MEIRIVTVGKIKEKYLNDGIAEYANVSAVTVSLHSARLRMKRHRTKLRMH